MNSPIIKMHKILTIWQTSLLCMISPIDSYKSCGFSFCFVCFCFFIHVTSYYIHHSIFLSYQSETGHSPPPAYTPMSGVSISQSTFIFQDFESCSPCFFSLVSPYFPHFIFANSESRIFCRLYTCFYLSRYSKIEISYIDCSF